MSDEVASATLQTSQKAIEVALELIKMLAPFAEKLLSEMYHKSVSGVNFVGGKIANARAAGTVSNKALIAEAQKAQSPISSTSNFLARDAERITEKAREYKIPIAIIGNGEKQTVEFLDRDKAVMEQIFSEVMQERINGAPQLVKCFSVGENNIVAMKAAFEENGIECQFMGGKDGKVTCIYPAENAEQVAIIKEDYKKMHNEVAEHCKIAADIPETEKMTEIKAQIDELKNAEIGSPMRSEVYDKTLSEMREKGVKFPEYSENNNRIIEREMPEAKQAAGKAFWESQGFKLNEGAKGIEIIAPETDDKGNPVLDENGNKTVGLTPAKMTEAEMKDLCVNELGLSEYQADKTVAKAVKIEGQVRSQIEERTVDKQGISREINIERTSDNTFSVKLGNKEKFYNLSMINLDVKIAEHFDIPRENARNIINKAQKQSVLQNRINNSVNKKKPLKAAAETPKIKTSKGLKH